MIEGGGWMDEWKVGWMEEGTVMDCQPADATLLERTPESKPARGGGGSNEEESGAGMIIQ